MVAGSVLWMVLAFGTDFLVMAVVPERVGLNGEVFDVSLLLTMLAYCELYAVFTGWVTAALAQRDEVRHALALGVLQLVLGVVGTIANAGKAPLWFSIAVLALIIPSHVLGGMLRASQRRRGYATPSATTY